MTEPTSRMERPVMNADTHRGVWSVAGGWCEWCDTLGPCPLPTLGVLSAVPALGPGSLLHCPPQAAPLGCLLGSVTPHQARQGPLHGPEVSQPGKSQPHLQRRLQGEQGQTFAVSSDSAQYIVHTWSIVYSTQNHVIL